MYYHPASLSYLVDNDVWNAIDKNLYNFFSGARGKSALKEQESESFLVWYPGVTYPIDALISCRP